MLNIMIQYNKTTRRPIQITPLEIIYTLSPVMNRMTVKKVTIFF